MPAFLKKIRLFILVGVIILSLCLSLLRLMQIQIVEGEELLRQSVKITAGEQTISAPRGEIVDVSGDPLVQNKVGYSIIVEQEFFPTDNATQNDIIIKTTRLLSEAKTQWIENMPISKTSPYTYLPNSDSKIDKMKSLLRLNAYATPQNCIDKLIEMYEISDKYTPEEKRTIAGIRYEMLATQFSVSNRYTFAQEVPMTAVSKIKELSYMLQGIDVIEEPIRIYPDGTIFPHGIGTTGKIDAEEYETLKDKGYNINDIIGKSGIENAMESELRGKNGTRNVVLSPDNQVTSIVETKAAEAGHTVKLTIDKDFQKKAQQILADTIVALHSDPLGQGRGVDATAGAIVVIDVKTGAIKAMATYPSYDMNEYLKDFNKYSSAPNTPLVNRATNGLYRPGSTFKTITSTAALNEGVINENTTFLCQREYKYLDVTMHCTGYHGNINVVHALEKSCNIFYYNVSQHLGIDRLVNYEKLFGFGTAPKIEIGAASGYISSPETFKKLGIDWTPGQLLQSAIGQSEVTVSPLQMACQAMTIANKGVRYRPYLVDSILSYDQKEVISKTQPIIEAKIEDKTGKTFDIVKQGMLLVANNSLVSPFSANRTADSLTTLPGRVAIKTGTPQRGGTYDSAVLGFYPADNPEIAFSVFIEKGEYSKYTLRRLIDAYYGYDKATVQNAQKTPS